MGYLVSVHGSSIDEFYHADSYPKEGDFSMAQSLGRRVGGPPLNVGCVCASKGGDVRALDLLNENDESSTFIENELKRMNVDTSHVEHGQAINGKVVIINTENERTMFVVNAARPFYKVTNELQEFLNNATYIYSMMFMVKNSFENFDAIKEARKHGAKVIFDGSSKYTDLQERDMIYDLCDGLFVNTEGYQQLANVSNGDPKELLFERGCEFVCITDGSKEARCFTKDHEYRCPALKIKVLDSTGAGDSFAGAFLYGRLNGYDYDRCLRIACANGAYACTKFGGQGGVCSFEELRKFAQEHQFNID